MKTKIKDIIVSKLKQGKFDGDFFLIDYQKRIIFNWMFDFALGSKLINNVLNINIDGKNNFYWLNKKAIFTEIKEEEIFYIEKLWNKTHQFENFVFNNF